MTFCCGSDAHTKNVKIRRKMMTFENVFFANLIFLYTKLKTFSKKIDIIIEITEVFPINLS